MSHDRHMIRNMRSHDAGGPPVQLAHYYEWEGLLPASEDCQLHTETGVHEVLSSLSCEVLLGATPTAAHEC